MTLVRYSAAPRVAAIERALDDTEDADCQDGSCYHCRAIAKLRDVCKRHGIVWFDENTPEAAIEEAETIVRFGLGGS